jgi:GT2 family glycosyltransferase
MPEPGDPPRHHVTTVLVVHDGERWLPRVLDGLDAQTRAPDAIAVADTASGDAGADLVRARRPETEIVALTRVTGYGAAVKAALAHADTVAPAPPEVVQWVWLLHDDSEPDPEALEQLLAAVEAEPRLGIVGPKVRGWYHRRVLLEMGVTIDAGGRRETGLERGEEDQGQHDNRRETLGVSSAGMLVRRDVWDELGGFDPYLPLMRDDVDLCWRAWLAGHRVAVVPAAVVFHAEAAAAERRPVDCGSGRVHHLDRAGAMRVLLANLTTRAFLLALPRLLFGSLGRALGYLVAKVPRNALDEMLAVGTVLIRPRAVLRMRRARRVHHVVGPGTLRRLFPRPGRQIGLAREALAHTLGGRRVDREAIGRHRSAEVGSAAAEPDDLDLGAGGVLLRRLSRSPGALLVLGLSLLTLLADRHLIGGGRLLGGALLPTPDSLGAVWSTYRESWHPSGLGSPSAAPPYLGVIALFGTLFFGHVAFVVAFALLAAVPLAGLSAYLASAALPTTRALRVWAAVAYALSPVLTGAVAAGRLGTAVSVVLLPVALRMATSVVGSSRRPTTDRAAWAAALLLALLTAFTPLLWLLALIGAAAAAAARKKDRALHKRLAIALGAPLLLLLPWSVHLLRHPTRFLVEPGPTGPGLSVHGLGTWHLLLLNPAGPGSGPSWLGLGIVLAGLAGLALGRRTTIPVAGWTLAGLGYLVALVISRINVTAPAGGQPAAAWPGVALAVATLGALTAAVVGCRDLPERVSARDFGLVQPAIGAVAALALLAPAVGAGAWAVRGAHGPLHRVDAALVPAHVAAEADTADRPRTLVLRPARSDLVGAVAANEVPAALAYVLVRGAAPELGAADQSVPRGAYRALRALVGDLVSDRGDAQAQRLAAFAVRYVLVRGPVPEGVAAALDAVPGLERVSAPEGDGLWRVSAPTARVSILGPNPVDLPSGAVGVKTTIPAGPAGRVLALAEPADAGWHATLNGHSLPKMTRDGWAQGWTLPAAGGELAISHVQRLRGLETAVQGLALLVLIVLALPGAARRPGDDEDPPPVLPGARRHAHGDDLVGVSA